MRRERPIFSSSSTISNRLEAIGHNRKQHTESSAAQFSFHEFDIAAGQKRALARDGKAESHAALLKRYGRLEQRRARLFTQPGAGVVHFNSYPAMFFSGDPQNAAAFSGSLSRVFQQIGED